MAQRQRLRGFTLIELLVVIAIIAILAAILFPVFQSVRERARAITCTSNLKQVVLGIMQYNQEYDETMPIAFDKPFEYGTLSSKLTGHAQQGEYMEIMPYVKSTELFRCPDDGGFDALGATPDPIPGSGESPSIAPPAASVNKQSFFDVYGSSYHFTHDNFSNPYPDATKTGFATNTTDYGSGGTLNPYINGTGFTYTPASGDTATHKMPPTMYLAFFARPAETRFIRDYDPPFDTDDDNIWHPNGGSVGYVDGHVKFVTGSRARGPGLPGDSPAYYKGCDGPDWAWDVPGSCNARGLQRAAN